MSKTRKHLVVRQFTCLLKQAGVLSLFFINLFFASTNFDNPFMLLTGRSELEGPAVRASRLSSPPSALAETQCCLVTLDPVPIVHKSDHTAESLQVISSCFAIVAKHFKRWKPFWSLGNSADWRQRTSLSSKAHSSCHETSQNSNAIPRIIYLQWNRKKAYVREF